MSEHGTRVLAVETSGSTFSIALAEGEKLLAEIFWHSGLSHSERLVPAVEWMLREAGWSYGDLGKVAVSTGPGSFTGIRVGLTFARTLAQARKLPLVGMTSLEVLAAGIPGTDLRVVPAIDALRDEVFVFGGNGEVELRSVDAFCAGLKRGPSKVLIAGNAALVYGSRIRKALGKKAVLAAGKFDFPRAGVLAIAAAALKGRKYAEVKPLYIRRSWAEER